MPQLDPIIRALDFLETNLQRPIGVADMAEAVAYSLYHFSRSFNRATHHTPYDYLMRRRLAEAARDLFQTDRKLIEIALDYQFKSPEVFSRAFKRVHRMGPNQFRKRGKIAHPGLMPPLTMDHLVQIGRGCLSKPVVEQWEPVSLVGVMSYLEGDSSAAAQLWALLTEELDRLGAGYEGACYGVTWFPAGREVGGRLYLAAVAKSELDIDHSSLVSRRLPAQLYAGFVHKGSASWLPLTLDLIYHTWLPRSNCTLTLPLVVERLKAPSTICPHSVREIWIPISEG